MHVPPPYKQYVISEEQYQQLQQPLLAVLATLRQWQPRLLHREKRMRLARLTESHLPAANNENQPLLQTRYYFAHLQTLLREICERQSDLCALLDNHLLLLTRLQQFRHHP